MARLTDEQRAWYRRFVALLTWQFEVDPAWEVRCERLSTWAGREWAL